MVCPVREITLCPISFAIQAHWSFSTTLDLLNTAVITRWIMGREGRRCRSLANACPVSLVPKGHTNIKTVERHIKTKLVIANLHLSLS